MGGAETVSFFWVGGVTTLLDGLEGVFGPSGAFGTSEVFGVSGDFGASRVLGP